MDDLLRITKPKTKSKSTKSALPPALRRRLSELLHAALEPLVQYSDDPDVMRKQADEIRRQKITEALAIIEKQ